MERIIVVGKYPLNMVYADGYLQRIVAIDSILSSQNVKRVYLDIGFNRNYKFKHIILEDKLEVFKLNFLAHGSIIKSLIEENTPIYVHSLYNYIKVSKFIRKAKKLILDVHGIIPEENLYMKKFIKAKIFNSLEKEVFQNDDWMKIFVTEQMRKFYEEKYGLNLCNLSMVFPTFSKIVLFNSSTEDPPKTDELLHMLDFNKEDVIFLYSGGAQQWQNTEEMVYLFSKLTNKKFKFLILTQEIKYFTFLMKKHNISEDRYRILSATSDEIVNYYRLANYGVILRDENSVNRVACPTKLVEYLSFGIIPIVKSSKIGDFEAWNVEYLKMEDINNNLIKKKSEINMHIVEKLKQQYSETLFIEKLDDYLSK